MIEIPTLRAEDLVALCEGLFVRVGVPKKDALLAANCLVNANLRGMDGQGVRRLRQHVGMIHTGTLNPTPRIHVVTERTATAVLDGDYGLGFLIGTEAMNLALKKAQATGLGVVTARNTNDFGMASNYAMLALDHDCIGIVMANTLPWVAPYGGRSKILGTNPICIAIPSGGIPFVLDLSTSSASHSKIEKLMEEGRTIPPDWALDPEGNPTTDPSTGLKGALSPLGGYKGFGLGLVADVLSGALSGMDCGSKVEEISLTRKSTHGQIFLALRISAFEDREAFTRNVDKVVGVMRSSPLAPDASRTLIPGERAFETRETRLAKGIPVPNEIWRDIASLCEENDYDTSWIRIGKETSQDRARHAS